MAMTILDPTNGSIDVASGFVTAPRPVSLDGQTFGIMANGLGDSEIMFDALYARLAEDDGVSDVVKVVKASVAVPPYPEEWDRFIASATVAVIGLGGCGSCSTRSMRDTPGPRGRRHPRRLHRPHRPGPGSTCHGPARGLSRLPIVTIDYPHNPTGAWTKEEALALADEIALAVRVRRSSLVTLGAPARSFDTADEALEACFELGWTDGLPVAPPPRKRSRPCWPPEVWIPRKCSGPDQRGSHGDGRESGHQCRDGRVPPRAHPRGGGGRPRPPADEGQLPRDDRNPCRRGHVVIVNGPVRQEIGIHSGQACFGPGSGERHHRPCLRLVIRNVCRAIAGEPTGPAPAGRCATRSASARTRK